MLLPSCTTHQCPYPVPHFYTHTFREGLRCTCALTGGGERCGKGHQPHPPYACRYVACTMPAILPAGPHNIPPHGRHRACGRAIAYCTEVRSIWCGHSPFSQQLQRQGQRIDPHCAKVHTWLLYLTCRHAQRKCNYALSVPLQRWLGGNNQGEIRGPEGCATLPVCLGLLGRHAPQTRFLLKLCSYV